MGREFKEPGTVRKVVLIRVKDTYVPAMQVHTPECDWPGRCCKWENVPCVHLKSDDVEQARKAARGLATRAGVPCEC